MNRNPSNRPHRAERVPPEGCAALFSPEDLARLRRNWDKSRPGIAEQWNRAAANASEQWEREREPLARQWEQAEQLADELNERNNKTR